MKVTQDGNVVTIDIGTWKLRIQPVKGADQGWLDLNLLNNKLSPMKVQPQAGNVIRIQPDERN